MIYHFEKYPEITVPWRSFSSKESQIIVTQYLKLLQLPENKLLQLQTIFDIVKPEMILTRNETKAFCRIKQVGQQDAIRILLKNYI